MEKMNTYLIIGGLVALLAVGGIVLFNSNNPMTTTETENNQMMEGNNDVKVSKEEEGGETGMNESNTIVDIAVADGRFETLVAALQAAELVDTLSGEGPFTVFAPTDDAFDALPEGTVESLLEDKEQLTSVLTYHVVPGKVMASDVVELDSAETVQGQELSIDATDGVMVNDANVILTDIEASNGVIHVIDAVLLPE
jgi:uncharacterized surface protein with fasciclin (FAS1) repeats